MNRPLGLVVVALLLFPGCGLVDGWTVGTSRGSGGMDIDPRLGSGSTNETTMYVEATFDAGTRAEAAEAQIALRHLIANKVSVNARQTSGEIDELRKELADERALNAESLLRIAAVELERDELREAAQAHEDKPLIGTEQVAWGGSALAIALIAWFKSWLWALVTRSSKD
jgi:hypothetical protein